MNAEKFINELFENKNIDAFFKDTYIKITDNIFNYLDKKDIKRTTTNLLMYLKKEKIEEIYNEMKNENIKKINEYDENYFKLLFASLIFEVRNLNEEQTKI